MTRRTSKPRGRWLRNGFILLLVLIAGLHFIGWRLAADEMRKTVDLWVADQREAGMEVEHGKIDIRGYPFFLRARAPDVMMSDGASWRWRAEILDIDLTPDALNRLTFRPRGEQSFETTEFGSWNFEVDGAAIHLANDETREWTLDADIASGQFKRNADDLAATSGPIVFSLGPNASDLNQLDTTLRLNDLKVAANGEQIEAPLLDVTASLTATHALSGEEPQIWRQAGGALVLTRVLAELEGTEGDFSGRVSIDEYGYPAGVIDASIKKPAGLARALGKAGAMPQQQAQAAEAGLAMASIAQGGKIAAPVVLKNGKATIAGVTLGDLPRVE